MAQDLLTRVHTPAYLQQIAIRYRSRDLVADRLAPRVRVAKQSDKYRIFADSTYEYDSAWAPGMIPNVLESRWSEDQFYANLFKLRHPLLDHELINADGDIQLRSLYTENTTRAIEIGREVRVARLFTNPANYQSSHVLAKAGGAEWDTVLGATPDSRQPFQDLEAMAQVVADDAQLARAEMTVALPEPVYTKCFARHPLLLPKDAGFQRAPAQAVADALGVKEVILTSVQTMGPGPQKATSDIVEGVTRSYLWGDNVWVGLVAPAGNDLLPTFARSFHWAAATGGQDRRVREYRMADEGQEGNWIEVSEAIGEKITARVAGALIRNTLSTI